MRVERDWLERGCERVAVRRACWGGCIGRNFLLTPPPCSPRQFAAPSALSPNSRWAPAGTASKRRLDLTACTLTTALAAARRPIGASPVSAAAAPRAMARR